MKQMKLISIVTFICIILISLTTLTYAVDESFELQLNSLTKEVVLGNTFEVDIVLDNMNVTSGDQGIGAYSARITYDTTILELVSVQQATGWEVMENENNLVALTNDGEVVKDRTVTATATFKVMDDAVFGDTTISLENISGSSGVATIAGTPVSKTITIEEKNEDNEDGNTTGGDNTAGDNNTVGGNNEVGENNVTGNNIIIRNNTSISSNADSSATANKNLPYAGFTRVAIIGIVILIMASIVFYIKYKRAV